MADPLIGFRGATGAREPVVLGTGLSVREIADVVRAQAGSVPDAAQLLGLDPRLIQAAVDYVAQHDPAEVPADGTDGGKRVIELLGQTAAVIALITAMVYVAGAVVLGLRLAFTHVPWEAVLGQLPRELIITTGARQVLLPALLVALAYAGFRLVRGTAATAPSAVRWSANPHKLATAGLMVLVSAALLAPAVLFVVLQDREIVLESRLFGLPDELWGPIVALVLVFATTMLCRELRAVAANRYRTDWNQGATSTAAMSGVYAIAVVPALIAFGAGVPLPDAKVCATAGYEEVGYLIAQASDRIYLGEKRLYRRRLAVVPLSQTEQLFVGPVAGEATCNVPDAAAAVKAQAASDTADAAAETAASLATVPAGTSDEEVLRIAGQVADAAGSAGLEAFAVRQVAKLSAPEAAEDILKASDAALAQAEDLRRRVASAKDARPEDAAARRAALIVAIADASRATEDAAEQARSAADELMEIAKLASRS